MNDPNDMIINFMKMIFIVTGIGFLLIFAVEIYYLITANDWSAVWGKCLIAILVTFSVIGGVLGLERVRRIQRPDSRHESLDDE